MINAQEWLDKKFPNKQTVTEIDLSDLKIDEESELIIDGFPNLTEIKKGWTTGIHKVVKVTVIDCPKLNKIDISWFWDNTSLNLNNVQSLTEINCRNNSLNELNVDSHIKLKKLDCSFNQITSLDLSNNKELVYLDFSANKISNLNIDKLPRFVKLKYYQNKITTFDISNLSKLSKDNFQLTINACEWLDNEYPKEQRSKIKGLDVSSKNLGGFLRFKWFC